ncbi:alpha/beta fold hydrolase [Massilia soli]|uniref:Alpha/beta fold hydrolase n=1 Tax=Massilia soli TaxID=2792854 RepID=A0ABS7SPK8_9BURK|nr:alpha/beta fold hydrolase [Massilia soli]MBZ2208120.1 alpha/beta fold hydrolase [Massilia soli]
MTIQAAGHGQPLLWAHGLLSSMGTEDALGWFGWNAQAEAARLIRYDARGHGGSSAPRGAHHYQWSRLGADMLCVADASGAPCFIAGGMSMGCAAAIHAAVQSPERVKGLILALPPIIWENRAAQRGLYKRIGERGTQTDGRALAKLMSRDLARTLPHWLTDASPGIAASLAIGVRALDRRIIPDLFHGAAMSDLPARAHLQAIAHIPTLILAWTGDTTHPLASAHELHELLPNSTLHIAKSHEDLLQFPGHIRTFSAGIAAPGL